MHNGEELRFAPAKPGDERFVSEEGGWVLDVDANGTHGRPQAFRFGCLDEHWFEPFFLSVVDSSAMFLMRTSGYELRCDRDDPVVGGDYLRLPPMPSSYSAATAQKSRIGTARTASLVEFHRAEISAGRSLCHSLKKHVDLHADEQRRGVAFHLVNDLQDAGIDALGVVAGQRLFRDHIGLDAHE